MNQVFGFCHCLALTVSDDSFIEVNQCLSLVFTSLYNLIPSFNTKLKSCTPIKPP